jgi:hypothetical protein
VVSLSLSLFFSQFVISDMHAVEPVGNEIMFLTGKERADSWRTCLIDCLVAGVARLYAGVYWPAQSAGPIIRHITVDYSID